METQALVSLLQESLFMILVFAAFLIFAMIRGRQALVNVILALYFAFLISLKFPYYDQILSGEKSDATIIIVIFAILTILSTAFFGKLMITDPEEPAFENFNRKVILSVFGSILIMLYSFHVLPVTDIITPGTPIQSLFAPEQHFFWWLLAPLAVIYFIYSRE